MSVLILTIPGDYHAHAIRWAIERLGGAVKILYPLDLCGGTNWSFDPSAGALWFEVEGVRHQIRREDYSTLWVRRPGGLYPRENIEDPFERAVAEEELRLFVNGVLKWFEFDKFTVNPGAATTVAGQKSFQLALAASLGLSGPRTLISNSKSEILSFFESCGNEFIYKPLKSALWTLGNGNKSIVPTTQINDKEMLLNSDLEQAPGIFQEKIVKKAEIRATFMGRSVFAWEKTFSKRSHESLDIDWRCMHRDAEHDTHVLPDYLTAKCFSLMAELGLVYGAFDFAIDADGNYQFLEVNPQGQFLWGDHIGVGLNQLEAFAEFLLSGDKNFQYSKANRFSILDYDAENLFERDCQEEASMHYASLNTFNYKQLSIAF